ncbi:type IV toxin-antitoxin system AbiEi family antitoxin domain-containing protein [Lactiplantibacillus pingfangensis]|uniref:type IV toxin-antitoxin system AbiEi family antitoxin domain-containing protein n=1 Tax=Lactiplantibacillus pingfangensis TaxID=2559915 RepID=UPI0010F4C86F|nr:hypothetical protein [Lactiplantibacillus pingfangensis]
MDNQQPDQKEMPVKSGSDLHQELQARITPLKFLEEEFERNAIIDTDLFEVQLKKAINPVLTDLVRKGLVENPVSNLFFSSEWSPNDFLLRQLILKQGVYSGETALYLWELSDQYPYRVEMTFKRGYKLPKRLPDKWASKLVIKQTAQDTIAQSVRELAVSGTNYTIKLYSPERALVELLQGGNNMDMTHVSAVYKRYLKKSNKNVTKLLSTAYKTGKQKQVRKLIEVLL